MEGWMDGDGMPFLLRVINDELKNKLNTLCYRARASKQANKQQQRTLIHHKPQT